jgi:DNA modification methylase
MTRTKALGLLHKQIKKDSSMSRMGLPDYVVFMRKPGTNTIPITHTNESYPVSKWQKVAEPCWDIYPSPVWWDINQSDTLNARMAKTDEEEKHICPLQLPVIERIVDLYSNPDEIVMTPFLGISSEIYQAVKMGRRGIGIELKKSYFDAAVKNMKNLDLERCQMSIFDFIES